MKELKAQLVSALLVIITMAAIVGAAFNFQQQSRFHLPEDGVTWIDRTVADPAIGALDRPTATYISPGSPAEKAGIRVGDVLVSIDNFSIDNSLEATQVLARLGAWRKAEYKLLRGNIEVSPNVIIGEAEHDSTLYYQYAVGVLYLGIGLFVYFRRGGAPQALHFFLLCLSSFILSTFHYTGKLNGFDKTVYWANLTANFLAPSLFLHFCFIFPEPQTWIRRKRAAALVYLPGLALFVIQTGVMFGWLRSAAPLIEVRWLLDRVWLTFLCGMYVAGGIVLAAQMRRAHDPVIRRQLAWLRNGALVGMLPFALIYAVPYVMGVAPNHAMGLAVLSLPLIPLTWAYAILRHRLMDVDIIFQEGYVYTLATLCVLGIFYGMIFSVSHAGDLNGPAMVAMILFAAFVFQPIRNWIQEQLDRYYFYKDRYDYRRTLIEFARELGSPTDLDGMLESVAERLIRTLRIRHVAMFVWDESEARFKLQLACNQSGRQTENVPYGLDLSFLSPSPGKPYLFFERTRGMLEALSHKGTDELPSNARRSIAELELTYYLPCSARGRTIAYLGVSRTETGDFLSSEDVELLVTLSGYVGIAIDNSMLYSTLARKAEQYERLKEFSENIVESINVGILAADLNNSVDSWNSQMEKLTGIARQHAVGKPLRELLPADLCDQLEFAREESGVANIYKYVLRPQDATLNIAIAPLVSREGERIGRLIIFDDVTDREELERRLIQADKLSSIGLLAAGVAHEVNTPLAVISTYAQMLAKQISGDAQKAPLLEKIARQTFRASEIVNSLLNFSRTAATEFVVLDLNKTITETLTLLEHQMATSGVRTDSVLDDTLPRIKGSPGKLQQVFLNLVLNARDAMENGGILSIRSTHREGVVRITITDTGSGIAPQHLLRIFDPFFTTKGAKKGTGLGLSVSYGIVREHGGEIEVRSDPGKGTTFELVFPTPGSTWKPEAARVASVAAASGSPQAAPPQITQASPRRKSLERRQPLVELHIHDRANETGDSLMANTLANLPPDIVEQETHRGKILVVDDEPDIRESLEFLLSNENYRVDLAANATEGLKRLETSSYDLVLLDLMMPDKSGMQVLEEVRQRDPDTPIFMLTAYGSIEVAVQALKRGASDYFSKPWDNEKLLIEIERTIARRRLELENTELKRALKQRYSFPNIVGKSERMLKILDLVAQVAQSRATILITGETGTGKELIANAIHAHSARAGQPFVPVHSGSVPPDLLESALFGHLKGAYTGATTARKGYFETANHGTVFFDEIGTISLETQTKLLRVIQEREFMPLGSAESIKVDVRIVAATNADVKKLVEEGRFREDLYYRLNVINLALPSLRERKEDIPLLVDHFFTKYCRENEKFLDEHNRSRLRFEPEAMQLLMDHVWPGNVRELENVVERAVVLASQPSVPADVLPEHLLEARGMRIRRDESGHLASDASLFEIVAEFERRKIIEQLEASDWSQTAAAEALRIPLSTLNQKIKRLNIEIRKRGGA